MNPLLVSICIPTYNGAEFLADCIASVLAQTLTDFEILIVDDCSSDGTVAIANECAGRDSRIRVLANRTNLGLVGNWNACMRAAQGEYVKFVFQDDLAGPTCLEELLGATRSTGVRFAFCGRDFIFGENATAERVDYYEQNRNMIESAMGPRGVVDSPKFVGAMIRHFPKNIVGEPTSVLMHRDVIREYGAFHPALVQGCDLEYWCRVASNESIAFVPEHLVAFRCHESSTTSRNRGSRHYRASVLDRLFLLHEFAFAPEYRNLRALAWRNSPRVNFVEEFYEEAHWVREIAREKAEAEPSDSSEWNELTQIAIQYPWLLEPPPTRYVFARKLRSLRRKCGLGGADALGWGEVKSG